MTNFKGTKGKWTVTLNRNAVIAEFPNQICSMEKSNPQILENGLLISKAPEMLEMLERIVEYGGVANFDHIKQLIKEATEL